MTSTFERVLDQIGTAVSGAIAVGSRRSIDEASAVRANVDRT
ncbi:MULTISPECIES: hypothetical protein [unclassified Curtobacterium]|nr:MULTISPECIES: hypothetical protein [unclassified Curtobacterium]MDT0235177.1 hypothetical protein [Curtobacterium sp. BRB10]